MLISTSCGSHPEIAPMARAPICCGFASAMCVCATKKRLPRSTCIGHSFRSENRGMTNAKLFLCSLRCDTCRCEQSHVLVQSRPGGFVSWDCTTCGTPRYVRKREVPVPACDRCGSPREAGLSPKGNYALRCPRCRTAVLLADLVPRWQDLFDFHGLPIDPEYCESNQQHPRIAVRGSR